MYIYIYIYIYIYLLIFKRNFKIFKNTVLDIKVEIDSDPQMIRSIMKNL